MRCDHIIGAHGGHSVRKSQWFDVLGRHAAGVHFFHTTKLTVPHHGYVVAHDYCLDCGAKLDIGAAKASISEAISVAVEASLGAGVVLPVESGHTRETYMKWLLAGAFER